jgi:hypothetical protein
MTLIPNGKWYTNPGWFLFIVALCGVLSGIFGNWISQTKDLSYLTGTVQALSSDQKTQDNKIVTSSERLAVLESNFKTMNEAICEIRKDVKEILKKR